MKKLNFAIEFNITPVILVATHQIIEISIKDELLGYVYIEENNTQADCIVPFTNEVEMPETDCIRGRSLQARIPFWRANLARNNLV